MWLKGSVDGVVSFLFQAEDGIRDSQESRGLGDVYKRLWQLCAMALQRKTDRSQKGGGSMIEILIDLIKILIEGKK